MSKRKEEVKPIVQISLHHNSLTEPQLRSLLALFQDDPEPYYRECRKVNKTIITIMVNHDLEKDKWAKGMLGHYKEVARIMESFYRLWDATKDNDLHIEFGLPING